MHIHSGWILSALLLVPNVLWLAWPSQQPAASGVLPKWATALRPVEMFLRVAVLTLPWFLSIDLQQPRVRMGFAVSIAGLLLYYLAWSRYFTRDRAFRLLFENWHGVPLPLAVAPVVYLVGASILTRSPLLAVATIVFGVVHIAVSAATKHAA